MREMLSGSRSPWLATPLIAGATYLGIYGLSVMIELGPWRLRMVTILLLVVAAIVVTRLVSRSRALPTIVGAVVGLLVCIPAFARDEEGNAHLLPTPAALVDFGTALRDGLTYAATTTAPAQMTTEFLAVLTVGMLILFTIAEHIAVSWRAAASAGLLLILPWMPAVILQHRIAAPMLMLAIFMWLLTLGVTKRLTATDRSASFGGALVATTAAIALVVVGAPTALGGNGWGIIPRFATPHQIDAATRLNLAIDLRNSLTSGSDSPVLVYVTSGRRPDVLRLYALTEFDGASWVRDDPEPTDRPANGGVLWSTGVNGWNDSEHDRLDVQVLALAESNLPVPAVPRTVDVDNSWSYVSALDEIVTDVNTTEGLVYSVVADLGYFDGEELAALTDLPSEDAENGIGPEYTEVAPAIDLERVQALTLEVTAEATSRYAQAIAVQSYLRNPADFKYNTAVQPQGADTVSTFLDQKEGYCVQFATTMVTMLRSIGVPTRLAVGFLPGERRSDGAYVIMGGDAHAWPEVFFPDQGWVRFEPTPAAQTGATPTYANPNSSQIPVDQAILDAAQNGGTNDPAELPEQGQGRPETSDAVTVEESAPWWAIALPAAALVVVVVLGLWWFFRRRRAVAAEGSGPEAAWTHLRSHLDEDVAWQLSLTPHEATEHVVRALSHAGLALDDSATSALTRLGNAVSDHRYAPQGTDRTEAELREEAGVVLDHIARATAEATGRPVRGGARSAPQVGS